MHAVMERLVLVRTLLRLPVSLLVNTRELMDSLEEPLCLTSHLLAVRLTFLLAIRLPGVDLTTWKMLLKIRVAEEGFGLVCGATPRGLQTLQ